MVLLDSNIFIYLANSTLDGTALSARSIGFASVTKIETLGYHQLSVGEEAQLMRLFDAAQKYDLSEAVIQQAIAIRQSKRIALGDAIIAATALENGCELWTANTKDFAGIEGLKLYNPLS